MKYKFENYKFKKKCHISNEIIVIIYGVIHIFYAKEEWKEKCL